MDSTELSGLVGLSFVVFAASCGILYGTFLLYLASVKREQQARKFLDSAAKLVDNYVRFEEKWAEETEERVWEKIGSTLPSGNTTASKRQTR